LSVFNGLKGLSLIIGFQGGSKKKLAVRIIKYKANLQGAESMQVEIDSFLAPTFHSPTHPEVTKQYRDHFNSVDRFDVKKAMIKYKPRIPDETTRVFISLVEVALIQTWSLLTSWKEDDHNESDIREFALELARRITE
jgi:hypothetical protein